MSQAECAVGSRTKVMAAPTGSPSTWLAWFARPTQRIIAYALFLTLLASGACFFHLSAGTLFGDEAAYAFTTDRMAASGDWVVNYVDDWPNTNATPLYNWLTLAIAPRLDQTPLWYYRFWSAVFGVGCVLMIFALGTLLVRAEVGLLAGLFLTVNRDFLFSHCVRFGGMDAMLTFFVTTAAFCYAWLQLRPGRGWLMWGLLGTCIGLAWLSKPPAFGSFFFALIVLHHIWVRRRDRWAVRLCGPLLACAVGLLIAAPWYVLIWSRLGNPALHALFVFNSVERALHPESRDLLCCQTAIGHASNSFKVVDLALLCVLICCLFPRSRRSWAGGLFLVVGYLAALTAVGKCAHYIYYVFPLLCLVLADFFLDSGPRLIALYRPALSRKAAIVSVCTALVLVGVDAEKIVRTFRAPVWVHPPLAIYERFRPELEQQHCRLVLCGFPKYNANFEDIYYARHMPLAEWVNTNAELTRVLDDGKPAIVLLPPLTFPQPPLAELHPELRVEDNPCSVYSYQFLMFHGAGAELPLAEWVRLARAGQR